jgi:pyruvate/2-oxoglutarate dehydrogenase complex dihydrolipoamide acyltransferase (E2) component
MRAVHGAGAPSESGAPRSGDAGDGEDDDRETLPRPARRRRPCPSVAASRAQSGCRDPRATGEFATGRVDSPRAHAPGARRRCAAPTDGSWRSRRRGAWRASSASPSSRCSGPDRRGACRVEDVRRTAGPRRAATAGGLPASVRPVTPKGYEDRERRVPLRGLRRAITHHMVASHLHSVRTLHVDEADVTELVRLRERLKPRAEARGVRLSYLPLIMKAVGPGAARLPGPLERAGRRHPGGRAARLRQPGHGGGGPMPGWWCRWCATSTAGR